QRDQPVVRHKKDEPRRGGVLKEPCHPSGRPLRQLLQEGFHWHRLAAGLQFLSGDALKPLADSRGKRMSQARLEVVPGPPPSEKPGKEAGSCLCHPSSCPSTVLRGVLPRYSAEFFLPIINVGINSAHLILRH